MLFSILSPYEPYEPCLGTCMFICLICLIYTDYPLSKHKKYAFSAFHPLMVPPVMKWMNNKRDNCLDTNTSVAQLEINFKSWKTLIGKKCFHAKWTLFLSWGKVETAQVQLLICVSMVLSLGFVNSTGVMVIVSHNIQHPDAVHTYRFWLFLQGCCVGLH